MKFRIELTEFTGIFKNKPGRVIQSFEFNNYMDALKQHNALGNSILYSIEDESIKRLDVLSKGFKPERIRQHYLSNVCDYLGLEHLRFEELATPDKVIEWMDKSIDRILQEGLEVDDKRISKPIKNEMIYWINRRKTHVKESN